MMDQKNLTYSFLTSTGMIPVPCRPNSKDPTPDWDCRQLASRDHSRTIRKFMDGEGNIGALFHGRYVDLDVDNENPTLDEALEYFMPRTPYVWGRASKPRSHRAYVLNDDFDRSSYSGLLRFIQTLKVGGELYSVELRGGKAEANFYTVLPGSIHPDGEEYKWLDGIDPTRSPTICSVDSVITGLRLSIATSLISRYWTSGVRNSLSLALTGLMWRIRSTSLASFGVESEDDVGAAFVLTRDTALSVLKAVMEISGDEPNDKRTRLANFENTWKKMDSDPSIKTMGGAAMADLIGPDGDFVVRALYRLLSDNEGAEQLEKLSEQFTVWYGQGVVIDIDMVRRGIPRCWMTREQLTVSLGSKKIVFGEKKARISDVLFVAPVIRRVYGLTFNPRTTESIVETPQGDKVNQWSGFETEPVAVADPAMIEPFKEYVLNVLCSGDQNAAHWVTAWLADIFQNPGQKCGTSLVLIGRQGAGKSFLGEAVVGPIIGDKHVAAVKTIGALTTRFNNNLGNKIFVRCEEAVHGWQKDVADQVKSIITDDFYEVEPKGVDKYQTENHMRFMFTSNHPDQALLIDADPDERRYTVMDVSNHRNQDLEYWTKMHEWVVGARPHIMRYLMEYEYDKSLIRRPYATEAKSRVQRLGIPVEVSWMVARISSGHPLAPETHKYWWQAYNSEVENQKGTIDRSQWPDFINVTALEEDFRAFARSMGRTVYSGSIITTIRKILPTGSMANRTQMTVEYYDEKTGQRVKARVRCYSFPSAEDIADHLRTQYGAIIDSVLNEVTGEGDVVEITSEKEDLPF